MLARNPEGVGLQPLRGDHSYFYECLNDAVSKLNPKRKARVEFHFFGVCKLEALIAILANMCVNPARKNKLGRFGVPVQIFSVLPVLTIEQHV